MQLYHYRAMVRLKGGSPTIFSRVAVVSLFPLLAGDFETNPGPICYASGQIVFLSDTPVTYLTPGCGTDNHKQILCNDVPRSYQSLPWRCLPRRRTRDPNYHSNPRRLLQLPPTIQTRRKSCCLPCLELREPTSCRHEIYRALRSSHTLLLKAYANLNDTAVNPIGPSCGERNRPPYNTCLDGVLSPQQRGSNYLANHPHRSRSLLLARATC